MGRHRTPGTGKPTPDTGFWVRAAAALVALVLVSTYLLVRDDDAATTAAPGPTTRPADSAPPASATASPSATPTPSPTPSATPATTKRPPTLQLRVLRRSYITVRVPGGRTLVSRLFTKGEARSFDQKVLQVVNGRPSAVRFTVNGEPRKPGPADEPETFTVRRR